MGEVSRYPHGTFCWIDLGTTDVATAKVFYRGLFGWDTEDVPTGDGGVYTLCRLHGKDVAGVHEHTPDEGVGWSSNISVDDVDATTAEARDLGAAVLAEPLDIPDTGRTSVLRDPSGAVVSLWQPAGHVGAGLVNEIGTWTWAELVSPDLDAARAFYTALLGWQAEDVPGPLPRVSFTLGDLLVAGAHAPSPQEGDAAAWTVSFRVTDADASAARARQLGGTVLLPPMDIPIGRFTVLADPTGAAFIATAFAGPVRGVDGS